MGDVSDIGDLLGKALREKRARVLWAIGTAVFTASTTLVSVSWKMRGYVDELEHENEKLRGEIRAIAKTSEMAEADAKEALKGARGAEQEARDAKAQADKAMLYAQLTKRDKQ